MRVFLCCTLLHGQRGLCWVLFLERDLVYFPVSMHLVQLILGVEQIDFGMFWHDHSYVLPFPQFIALDFCLFN